MRHSVRKDIWYSYRHLTPSEEALATNVFRHTLPYAQIYIANGYLPFFNVPATLMQKRKEPNNPSLMTADFTIYWDQPVFGNGADNINPETFIHELTHVWQGWNERGTGYNYMVKSLQAQGKAFIEHFDRGGAYDYDMNNYLKWSDYNPEQQGKIVSDWFSSNQRNSKRGNSSPNDSRFVYIEKVIRAANPQATDVPNLTATQTPAGFSLQMQTYQRMLIRKGYKIKDDGFWGKQTENAVKDLQRRNGLKPNGFIGPKTLSKMK